MANNFNAREFQARLERLETLLRQVDRLADPAAKTHARELVQAVLDLHAVALERLLERMNASGEAGAELVETCARDDVVAGMLLLHGLHPHGVEERVRQALEQVRPYLRSHGGNVELLEVDGETVRLRLEGSCHSCPSSAVTMQQTIEEAIYARAPEVTSIAVEGMRENAPLMEDDRARVALPMV